MLTFLHLLKILIGHRIESIKLPSCFCHIFSSFGLANSRTTQVGVYEFQINGVLLMRYHLLWVQGVCVVSAFVVSLVNSRSLLFHQQIHKACWGAFWIAHCCPIY